MRVKIGKVKPKSGLVLLDPPGRRWSDFAKGQMVFDARTVASYEGTMTGYVTFAFYSNMSRVCTFNLSPDNPVSIDMLPIYVHNILQKELTIYEAKCE